MNSEVARLMQRIADEHEAAQRGLTGITEGAAKHRFITAHMERMWTLKDELGREVGDDAATAMVCQVVLSEQGAAQ